MAFGRIGFVSPSGFQSVLGAVEAVEADGKTMLDELSRLTKAFEAMTAA